MKVYNFQDEEKRIRECRRCGEIKPFEMFSRAGKCVHGISWSCISCEKQRKREYKTNNKEKVKKSNYEYAINNKEKLSKYHSKWYMCNRNNHKKKRDEYYRKNKDKTIKKGNEYRTNRKQKDIEYKIRINLRSRFYSALKKQGVNKNCSSIDIVGCTNEELKKHLQYKFTSGMDWFNYGVFGWHIDHIKPCASFDLTDPKQQKECFHYTNLQPLWWYDNLSKGAKY